MLKLDCIIKKVGHQFSILGSEFPWRHATTSWDYKINSNYLRWETITANCLASSSAYRTNTMIMKKFQRSNQRMSGGSFCTFQVWKWMGCIGFTRHSKFSFCFLKCYHIRNEKKKKNYWKKKWSILPFILSWFFSLTKFFLSVRRRIFLQ